MLVCTLCCLDVSALVAVMMNLKIWLQVGFRALLGVGLDHHGMTLENTRIQACQEKQTQKNYDYFDQLNGLNKKYKEKKKNGIPDKICGRKYCCGFCDSHTRHPLITCPPAAQAATSPYCPPSFCSRCATVVTSLQPVAPNG